MTELIFCSDRSNLAGPIYQRGKGIAQLSRMESNVEGNSSYSVQEVLQLNYILINCTYNSHLRYLLNNLLFDTIFFHNVPLCFVFL